VITLTGSGFTGATAFDFGFRPAVSFIIVNDTTLKATVPTGTVGTVNVRVTAGSVSAATPQNYYTYTTSAWQGIVSVSTHDEVALFGTDVHTFNTAIPLPATSMTSVITPDGIRIYTRNDTPPGVSVIDAATNTVTATIPTSVGPGAFEIMVSPSGTRVYVTNIVSGSITVIDTATNTVLADVFIGPILGNVSTATNSSKLYVGSFATSLVYVIDMATNILVNTVFVGFSPGMISIPPGGSKAFIPILGNATVAFMDLNSDTIVNTIPVGNQPYGSSILSNGTSLYVVNIADASVSVIDIATETVTTTIPLAGGTNPFWIAATPDSKSLFVINEVNDQVTPIDVATNTAGAPFGGRGGILGDLVISPDPAPVAYFSATPQLVGVPTLFDASSSLSPIRTIVYYAWNFGDGVTVTTASLLINHTYLTPGAFNVSLTVTNSAGTSTIPIYSSRFMSNRGSPTAVRTQAVQALPVPPSDLNGFQKKCKFPSQTNIVNVIQWNPALEGASVTYQIYRDSLTHLIATVLGTGPFIYEDHNRHKNKSYTYYIVTVSSSGVPSAPVSITIPPKH